MSNKTGYPTEDELEKLLEYGCGFSFKTQDFIGKYQPDRLIEYLLSIWTYGADACIWNPETRILELHTLGWSGNETIIKTLEHTVFWILHWKEIHVGGHYYFKKIEKIEEKDE